MSGQSNKVKYGLKNVHFAVVTEANGVISYGTPVPIPGAVNLTLSPAGESVEFFADDGRYYEENTNNGYEGSLEIALIPDSFRKDILGDIEDENGALYESADAKPKHFALLYEFDGDVHKTRYVDYYVLAARPDVSGATTTNTKEPQTDTLNIAARPAPDTRLVRGRIKQDQTGYDTFFSAVYLKGAPTNTVTVSQITFSRAQPDDVTIEVTSTDENNAVKNVLLNGLPIPGVYLTAVGPDVTIGQEYIEDLANNTYTITVELLRGNAVTVTLTVGA